MTLPDEILKAIEDGPNMDERFNDEWRRRQLFATRIAEMAYTAGWKQGFDEGIAGVSTAMEQAGEHQ